jgi:hypothetical protein
MTPSETETEGAPAPGSELFTEADLEPGDDEKRARRHAAADRAAASVAAIALGLWAGGMVALGACAAPFVFELTPHPFSGHAMGMAFQRFDGIAIGCGVVVLGCEVLRTFLSRRRRTQLVPRIRRILAVAIACGAVYGGMRLTPAILQMHAEGVRRHVGAEGAELERLHRQAELIGKVTVPLALLLIVLHVFTVRSPIEVLEEEDEALAPRPPGPGS